MNKINTFRFFVFWIWAITVVVTLAVFIGTLIVHRMNFKDIEDSLTQIMGLLIPQISIMLGFLFGASKSKQSQILAQHRSLGMFAVSLSAIYHLIFWLVIVSAIGYGIFGQNIDDNCIAAIKILGFISIFGLSPVAYLFASGKDAS